MANTIYEDIACRTGGDIYVGVVGPVRSGKSTFIKRFMEQLVIPNIQNEAWKERATDELPQSAAGRTIMTTEPKFIPEDAVELTLGDNARMRIRMIDCVGYIIPSALGYIENEQPRMVHTPWFDQEVPFNMAAEVGTRKVIAEHSTIGLVVTTDGSITDLPRAEYAECEERVITELQELGKPFAVLLNCMDPHTAEAKAMAKQLSEKYSAPVLPVSCPDLDETDICNILTELLRVFQSGKSTFVCPSGLPRWKRPLAAGICLFLHPPGGIGDPHHPGYFPVCRCCQHLSLCDTCRHPGDQHGNRQRLRRSGTGQFPVLPHPGRNYRTGDPRRKRSAAYPAGTEPHSERIRQNRTGTAGSGGYRLWHRNADQEEMTLEEPEIIKQGGRYGVRLRASAPSIHMMRADIRTTVSPIVGTERQSEELVMYLLEGFEEDPTKIWSSNIFGKSLHELVGEGLHNKLSKMPMDARLKLQETLQRIINEGCSGLICFIL